MIKGVSWMDLWAEGTSTQDPKLGRIVASLESKETWRVVGKRETGVK